VIAELNAGVFGGKIVTEVKPLDVCYPAGEYHQGFYRNNPNQGHCMAVVGPKVAKFRNLLADLLQ
jgi:peptide-methionine (S)-S-oxide reductase